MLNDVENIFIVYVCCGPKAECFRCFLSFSVFVELFVFFLAVFSRQPLSIPLKFPKVLFRAISRTFKTTKTVNFRDDLFSTKTTTT